jgi:hypothetical protein
MVSDGATRAGAKQTVVPGQVTCHTANGGPLQAACRTYWRD